MEYPLDQTFTVTPVEGSDFRPHFPIPCTVREALTLYYDIVGPLRLTLVAHLLAYVTDPEQKAWLAHLVAKENRSHFHEYVQNHGLSIYSLLVNKLSSCKIPLSDFLNLIPFIQPRFYTISSSSSCFPKSIHVTVSVTRHALPSGGVITGLCSSFLANLTSGTTCRVFVRASSFRLPAALTTPIVMIGPGTGIAPMRAFLQEREYQQSKAGSGVVASNTLYFGCRRNNEDFIYHDELTRYEQVGVLSSLNLVFSRQTAQKVLTCLYWNDVSDMTAFDVIGCAGICSTSPSSGRECRCSDA